MPSMQWCATCLPWCWGSIRTHDNVLPIGSGAVRAVPIAWGLQGEAPASTRCCVRGRTPGRADRRRRQHRLSRACVQRLGGTCRLIRRCCRPDSDRRCDRRDDRQSRQSPDRCGHCRSDGDIGARRFTPAAAAGTRDRRRADQWCASQPAMDHAQDADGNIYTVNYNVRECCASTPMPTSSCSRSQPIRQRRILCQMGTPYALAMHPDGTCVSVERQFRQQRESDRTVRADQ